MKLRAIAVTLSLFFLAGAAHAQKVIKLYPGAAPGSESWTHQEKEFFSTVFNTQVVTNVSQPSLTAYLADKSIATGTAVIIAPGGGFHALSINSEGIDVAKWLNAKGVSAFVLKYRLVPTGEDGTKELMAKITNREKMQADTAAVVPLSVADGFAAVAYVRKHAAEFGINPQRIGLMGFSAGGTVTASVAYGYSADNRPDFLAPIYAFMGAVKEAPVPKDAPPMFIAAASDDQLGLAPDSVRLYNAWLGARKPVELHMYSKGGHGFGMRKQNLPSDAWIDRFGEWLGTLGLLKKP
ncbi:MAG TPA: alpha/beta hydrolase [Blastocatellia bacterium]|nr:alpha/beta hydrolase [Blastocatellia bacterium]